MRSSLRRVLMRILMEVGFWSKVYGVWSMGYGTWYSKDLLLVSILKSISTAINFWQDSYSVFPEILRW